MRDVGTVAETGSKHRLSLGGSGVAKYSSASECVAARTLSATPYNNYSLFASRPKNLLAYSFTRWRAGLQCHIQVSCAVSLGKSPREQHRASGL